MTWNFKMKFHTFLWKSYPPLTATIRFPVGGGVEICPFPLTWPLAYTTACTSRDKVMQFHIQQPRNVNIFKNIG